MATNKYYKGFDFSKAEKLIIQAINEDCRRGDITSELLIPPDSVSKAEILFKESGIMAGAEIFRLVFKFIDKNVKVKFIKSEGCSVVKNEITGYVSGNTRSILKGERVALNILQRMSGIATSTASLIKKLGNPSIKLIDTRKTTPNFRIFEKAAVKIGGGDNHRFGLFDMYLIKDNHIEANGGIENTLNILMLNKNKIHKKVEIEVKNIDELKSVLRMGIDTVDRIMLDNFSLKDIKTSIKLNKGIFEIEVSGGINEKNISLYRNIEGIDYISAGFLTHSFRSIDISLNFIT